MFFGNEISNVSGNVIEKFVKNHVLAYYNLFVLLAFFGFVSNWPCYEG